MKLQYTFGLIPIEGNDVWLHGAIAVAAAFFGWRRSEMAPHADDSAPRVSL